MARVDLVRDRAMPQGLGFSLTIAPPLPLIDCEGPFAVPAEALLAWAAEAPEGARCVYARCETMQRHPRLLSKARELARDGVISLQGLARYAVDSSLFDMIAKRTCKALPHAAAPARPDILITGIADEAMEIIFARIERAAAAGLRCPSDLVLAQAAGLATKHMAAWRMRKLEGDGRIRTETLRGPDGCAWRVVRIGKTRTAGPPKGGRR